MADTERDLAAVQALLADNTTGLIAPQDHRDAYVSVKKGGYGGILIDEGSTSQTAIGSTPLVVTGWTGNMAASNRATADEANNVITVDATGIWWPSMGGDINAGSTSVIFVFEIFVNAVATGFRCERKTAATSTNERPIAIAGGPFAVTAGQDIDLRVSVAAGGSEAVTLNNCTLAAFMVGET